MGTRILVIEDNPANLELMRYLLEASHYELLVAEDGERGLAIAQSDSPDLVLCDIQLPGIDGLEMVRRARLIPRLATIPIVAVTALAMTGDRERFLVQGFSGYIAKPIDPPTFVGEVESFISEEMRNAPPIPIASATRAPDRVKSTGRMILAVDNLPENLEFVVDLFVGSGYEVVTSTNPAEALKLAAECLPDLILSDVSMPSGSGYKLISAVKREPRLSIIPFVFITSTLTDEQARQQGLALGASKFLFRPIEPCELLREVRDCLEAVEPASRE